MSRPLSCREAIPRTDSSRSQSDSMQGFRVGHPNRRVRRSRRADPHPAGSGRVIRSGRGSGQSRSIDSQPLRRRIKCSDTRADLNGRLAAWLPGPPGLHRPHGDRQRDHPKRPRIMTALLWSSYRLLIIVRPFLKQPTSPLSFELLLRGRECRPRASRCRQHPLFPGESPSNPPASRVRGNQRRNVRTVRRLRVTPLHSRWLTVAHCP